MGVSVSWDHAVQHTILIKMDRLWTWDDIYELDPQTDALAASVDQKVCYLVDMSETREVPAGLSPGRFKEAVAFDQPNSDLVVVVAPNLFVQTMIDTIVKSVARRHDMVFAESLDAARAMIAARQRALAGS